MRTTFVLNAAVLAALVMTGCPKDEPSTTPGNNETGGDESSTGPGQSETGTPGDPSSTPSNPSTDPTTGNVDPSATDPSTDPPATDPSGTSGNFLVENDMSGGNFECDVWTQDCPAGQKCMPWADDGGGSWNATKCSPVGADPGQEGDECTVEGSAVSGIDSCDVGLLCWYVDAENQGSCIDMCTGSPDAPMCDDGQTCDVSNDGALILCLETCDPTAASCPEGQICFFDGVDNFICDFDASGEEGQYGDPCAFINVCDLGLFCANPEAVPGCTDASGCCSEFCNLQEPNTCSGAPDQECVPWYTEGMAPPGQENIGACAIPA